MNEVLDGKWQNVLKVCEYRCLWVWKQQESWSFWQFCQREVLTFQTSGVRYDLLVLSRWVNETDSLLMYSNRTDTRQAGTRTWPCLTCCNVSDLKDLHRTSKSIHNSLTLLSVVLSSVNCCSAPSSTISADGTLSLLATTAVVLPSAMNQHTNTTNNITNTRWLQLKNTSMKTHQCYTD